MPTTGPNCAHNEERPALIKCKWGFKDLPVGHVLNPEEARELFGSAYREEFTYHVDDDGVAKVLRTKALQT